MERKCPANVQCLPKTYKIILSLSGHLVFALDFHVVFHSQDQVFTHALSLQEFHPTNALSRRATLSFTYFLKHCDLPEQETLLYPYLFLL